LASASTTTPATTESAANTVEDDLGALTLRMIGSQTKPNANNEVAIARRTSSILDS
jgi:hypothetical protein